MDKNNILNQICVGCQEGRLKAAEVNGRNEFIDDTNKRRAGEAISNRAIFKAMTERFIIEHGGDSYSAAEFFRANAAQSADILDASGRDHEVPMQRVACDGPSRIFHVCLARVVEVR
jgi:hypothetical protein